MSTDPSQSQGNGSSREGHSALNATNTARRSLRLHASSYVVLALTAIVLFLLNVPGRYVPHVSTDYWWTLDDPIVGERLEHGWPLAYLIRDDAHSLTRRASETTAVWSFTENLISFIPWRLVIDVVAALCLMAGVALAAEYWRRQRRSIWQWRLIDLLGLTAFIAVATWYWLMILSDHKREMSAAEKVRMVGDSNWTMRLYSTRGGPTWLRSLVGDEHFPRVFDRLVYAFVVDSSLPELGVFKELKGLTLELDRANPSADGLFELRSLEGIEFDYHSGRGNVWGASTELKPDDLDRRLARVLSSFETLPKLQVVLARGDGVGDRSAKVLARLPRLRAVRFVGCSFGDEGLSAIADCTSLEELCLDDMEISVQGLAHLKKLPNLRVLSFWNTWLSGAAFEQLGELSTLEQLNLHGAVINDSGLHYLGQLSNLKYLSLLGSLESAAIEDLQRRLPKTKIDLYGVEGVPSDESTQ